MVDVAQLVRAPGCGPGGRRFEPDLPPLKILSFNKKGFFYLYKKHPNQRPPQVGFLITKAGMVYTPHRLLFYNLMSYQKTF